MEDAVNVNPRIMPDSPHMALEYNSVFKAQQVRAIALRRSTYESRVAQLRRLEAAIIAHQGEIYAALQADLHKPEAEADLSEILPVLSEIRHTCRHLRRWMAPQKVSATAAMFGTKAKIRHEPKGVALIISPWNYPINLTFGPLASAIAAGCTAIIKPSELTPHCSSLIDKIIADIFDSADVAAFEGDASVATALLDLPFDHIFFTGSPAVGKIVMGAAARHLSSVTLELGGKSPVIVDETANLTKAARSIVWGKFANNGQTCIAPDYAYVHEAVMPQFVDAARTAITAMYGDAATSADYCRIVNDRHFQRVNALIADAKTHGATVVAGGTSDAAQRYIAPTLMTGVPDDAALMQEEIFGPVLPIRPYRDINQPIREINAKPKPLALYIFTKNQAQADTVIEQTSAGGSCINGAMTHFLHAKLPFGGVNNSGIGNAHGYYGFRAFSHERAVLTDQFSASPMLFPPYNARVRKMIKLTMKFFT
ncbi:MAG: aldehyde dehydrogenase [Acidiphilium sp. 21-60-14]|nr:MAG: aldehyde dehydrogenase [Acidiphilium sp. 21-60-14]OYV92112.1 MAG: aldehyde dehydrogenase [Acidiphilium sp. 37-60-79]OZB38970.1 MAG: aldehyde dehydrogenase [Acidiphilium sp. 34-60-192]